MGGPDGDEMGPDGDEMVACDYLLARFIYKRLKLNKREIPCILHTSCTEITSRMMLVLPPNLKKHVLHNCRCYKLRCCFTGLRRISSIFATSKNLLVKFIRCYSTRLRRISSIFGTNKICRLTPSPYM